MKPSRIGSEKLGPMVSVFLLVAACGAPPAAESPAPESEVSEAAPPVEPEAEATDAPPAAETEAEPAADAPAGDADPEGRTTTRDVTYRSTPEGLKIEVEGVEFMPKATPVKMQGGWGVKIALEATSQDDVRHLLNPKNGPLAFAGKVTRKGKAEKFGDKRDGDDDAELGPGQTQTFTSTWPVKGQGQPLWWGNELQLDVGLWGLGRTADARRPIKKFFTLKMVAGNKPQPVIQPPASVE